MQLMENYEQSLLLAREIVVEQIGLYNQCVKMYEDMWLWIQGDLKQSGELLVLKPFAHWKLQRW